MGIAGSRCGRSARAAARSAQRDRPTRKGETMKLTVILGAVLILATTAAAQNAKVTALQFSYVCQGRGFDGSPAQDPVDAATLKLSCISYSVGFLYGMGAMNAMLQSGDPRKADWLNRCQETIKGAAGFVS